MLAENRASSKWQHPFHTWQGVPHNQVGATGGSPSLPLPGHVEAALLEGSPNHTSHTVPSLQGRSLLSVIHTIYLPRSLPINADCCYVFKN